MISDSPASGPARLAPFGFSAVVFLSHVNTVTMPAFPGDPPVELRPAADLRTDGYYLQRMAMGEHAGTHWAAPRHFSETGAAADAMDPADFFHPAAVIDVRAEASADPDFELGTGAVACFEREHGPIPPGAVVLAWTGFDERWADPAAYLNAGPDGTLHHPGFSAAAAGWLVSRRRISGLGIDALGIDPGRDREFAANRALLSGHRIHLENLTGLGRLPPLGGWVIVGGLRNSDGSGSPATIFGLVP